MVHLKKKELGLGRDAAAAEAAAGRALLGGGGGGSLRGSGRLLLLLVLVLGGDGEDTLLWKKDYHQDGKVSFRRHLSLSMRKQSSKATLIQPDKRRTCMLAAAAVGAPKVTSLR